MSSAMLGIDTGGTFTDFVLIREGRLTLHKVLSTPHAPDEAITTGIDELGLTDAVRSGNVRVIHGTTVATNAALEGKGVRTAFITNRGMGDMLTIGRQARARLYDLTPAVPAAPVPTDLIFEVDTRRDARGVELTALDDAELARLVDEVRAAAPAAVAVNLLYSFLDDTEERRIEAALRPFAFVSRSSHVLPEYQEYERGMATWLNAWIGPLVAKYLHSLSASLAPARISIMQSSGVTIAAEQAAERAVNLLLSGPAGGLTAARSIGTWTDRPRLMTFDMGGTSTDVAMSDGGISLTRAGRIRDWPVAIPMADIHTIGAGGGSIAFVDDGGLLRVGPRSAGAEPGPACYGRGGAEPTVTDANLVLERIPHGTTFGRLPLDIDAARRAVDTIAATLNLSVEAAAEGIIDVANEHMTGALRYISIERGYDPAEFSLLSFGGAGGLHFCTLAEKLDMRSAIIPAMGGVLSAFGMLAAPPGRELTRTHRVLLDAAEPALVEAVIESLVRTGSEELVAEGQLADDLTSEVSVDVRYEGQSFTLNLPWQAPSLLTGAFHAAHVDRYGHQLDKQVELVNVRVHLASRFEPPTLPELAATGPGSPQTYTSMDVPVRARAELGAGSTITGPLIIVETHATSVINSGWRGTVSPTGHILLTRE